MRRLRDAILALLIVASPAFSGTLPSHPPAIEFQPRPQATILGGRAIFTVIAQGTAPLEYRWRKDGTGLVDGPGVDGVKRDTLILTDVELDDTGEYSVIVTDSNGRVRSVEASLTVSLPSAGDIDFSFDAGSTINNTVRGFAVQPDGKVLIGGFFTSLKDVPRGGIARVHPDGLTDHTFGNGFSGANHGVYSVALQPDGKVVIGGSFDTVNGVPRRGIARLNPDGSLDASFLDGRSGVNGTVRALVLQPDGRVLIGGNFTEVNGAARNNLARLERDGNLDTSFQRDLSGTDAGVEAIALRPDGQMWIGGWFTTVNGAGRNHIARLKQDGSLPIGDRLPAGTDDRVHSLAIQPDGRVLIGGLFTTVNGASRKSIARLKADGRLDSGFLDGLAGLSGFVYSIAVQDDGRVLIAGLFYEINGVSRDRIARLDADGSLDPTFLDGLPGADHGIRSILLQPDGRVLIGGEFNEINGIARNHLARLEDDGKLDQGFLNGHGGPRGVRSAVQQPDGRVVVGGSFTTVDGIGRNRVARLHADGRLDTAFLDGPEGADRTIRVVTVQPDGRTLIGGEFDTVNGVIRNNLARLNADGTLDSTFMDGLAGPSGKVDAIVVQPDGRLLIAGSFTGVNEMAIRRVARLLPDGNVDPTFENPQVQRAVEALALQPDGRVLIGGFFEYIGLARRNFIARLNADGSLDTTFGDGLDGADFTVHAIALQDDGRVVVGGRFATMNGEERPRVARLHPDGSLDTSFLGPLDELDSRVDAVAVQVDGRVLIGGDFDITDGVNRRDGFARLDVSGGLDTTFLAGLAPIEGRTLSLALLEDGRVLATGFFSTALGRVDVVRVHGDVLAPPAMPHGDNGCVVASRTKRRVRCP